MRYVSHEQIEQRESLDLPRWFHKEYGPSGSVTLHDGVRIGADGMNLVDLCGHTLAVHADTASWAFVEPAEQHLLRRAQGLSLGELALAGDASVAGTARLVASMYRRGLLTLDGHRATAEDIFENSPN